MKFFDKINFQVYGSANPMLVAVLSRRFIDSWPKIGLNLMLERICDTKIHLELLASLTKQKDVPT